MGINMGKIVLDVKEITVKLQDRELIQNVNFSLKQGEIVGLLGPNGAGKSTIMKAIMGIMPISNGEIIFLKNKIKTREYIQFEDIGALIEIPMFYTHLSGWTNLKIFSRMYKKKILDKDLMKTVALLKMEDFVHQKVHKYSLGMKQRLGIAQAILHQPKLLLLDEPLNGLDIQGVFEMRETLKMLSKNDITILISSHHLSELERLADRYLLINEGKVMNSITKNEIMQETQVLYLKTSDDKLAYIILNQSGYKVHQKEDGINLELREDNLNHLLSLLLEKKIKIFTVEKNKSDLETYFIKKYLN